MTTKNDLRSVILSLGLGLVVTGMGVNAIACQNSSNRPPQPPISKGGLSSHSLNNEGLSSPFFTESGLNSNFSPLTKENLSPDSPPLTKGGTQGGSILQPQANGDYLRSPHSSWKATNPNPQGIDCRMLGNTTYSQLENPSNKTELNIENWPVVGKLSAGQDFEINLGPAGFGVVYDTKQQPWIYVEKTDQTAAPSHCFVRANQQFVQPISAK